MPIEFNCPSCQAKIRTPDNSAGRTARCPKCSTVVTIPAASSPGLAPPAGFSPPPLNPLGAPAGNPLGGPPTGSIPNPFSDRPATPFGPPPVNPYAPPAPAASQGYFQPMQPLGVTRDSARSWLLGPAIGSTIFAVCGLGFMALVVIGMTIDPDQVFDKEPQDPAERAGFYGFFVVYFGFGLLTRLLQILGAICMFRVRGYGLAMTAAICAILPCDVYCCIFCLPFGIWGLIVLNRPDVKAAFRLP